LVGQQLSRAEDLRRHQAFHITTSARLRQVAQLVEMRVDTHTLCAAQAITREGQDRKIPQTIQLGE
jgi:hypothetical protein